MRFRLANRFNIELRFSPPGDIIFSLEGRCYDLEIANFTDPAPERIPAPVGHSQVRAAGLGIVGTGFYH